jgi:hypothetical protein
LFRKGFQLELSNLPTLSVGDHVSWTGPRGELFKLEVLGVDLANGTVLGLYLGGRRHGQREVCDAANIVGVPFRVGGAKPSDRGFGA